MDIDFCTSIIELEKLISEAKEATKSHTCNELIFKCHKPLKNDDTEEECEYIYGRFNINRERMALERKSAPGQRQEGGFQPDLSVKTAKENLNPEPKIARCEICRNVLGNSAGRIKICESCIGKDRIHGEDSRQYNPEMSGTPKPSMCAQEIQEVAEAILQDEEKSDKRRCQEWSQAQTPVSRHATARHNLLLIAHLAALIKEHIEKYHPANRNQFLECPRCHKFTRYLYKSIKTEGNVCPTCFDAEVENDYGVIPNT